MIATIVVFLIIFWVATVAARWLGRPRIPKPQPMREHYAELNTFREVQYKRLEEIPEWDTKTRAMILRYMWTIETRFRHAEKLYGVRPFSFRSLFESTPLPGQPGDGLSDYGEPRPSLERQSTTRA